MSTLCCPAHGRGRRRDREEVIVVELPVKTYDADVTGGTLRVLSWGHGPGMISVTPELSPSPERHDDR